MNERTLDPGEFWFGGATDALSMDTPAAQYPPLVDVPLEDTTTQVPATNEPPRTGGYFWNSLDALSRIPGDLSRLRERAVDSPFATAGSLLASMPGGRLGAEGAPLLGAIGAGAIRAYHGSPHLFDRFRISENLLKGEGSNYIAPGGYFAGHEPVALRYAELAAPPPTAAHTRDVLARHGLNNVSELDLSHIRGTAAYQFNQLTPDELAYFANIPSMRRLSPAQREAIIRDINGPRPGHMYEVNLDVNPHQLLDWDAPLQAQPQAIRDMVAAQPRLGGNDVVRGQLSAPLGQDFYRRLVTGGQGTTNIPGIPGVRLSDPMAAVHRLRGAGIPGIQFFDQGSRAAGQGTRNYVVFPGQDELVEILRRYGIAGVTVGTGASLLDRGESQ